MTPVLIINVCFCFQKLALFKVLVDASWCDLELPLGNYLDDWDNPGEPQYYQDKLRCICILAGFYNHPHHFYFPSCRRLKWYAWSWSRWLLGLIVIIIIILIILITIIIIIIIIIIIRNHFTCGLQTVTSLSYWLRNWQGKQEHNKVTLQ